MPKVKINKEGKEIEVEFKNPKGRHTKRALKLLLKAEEAANKGNSKLLDEFMDYLDEVTCELTGMTMEKLDDLESDEKNKLVGFFQSKVTGRVDFLKSSLNVPDSAPKGKKEQ